MKVWTCKVYDGIECAWTELGVFSTCAKAMCAGGLYLAENADNAHLIDWDHEDTMYTDWYQDDNHTPYTRFVREWNLDNENG
jgi:hypothetical protein